MLRILVVSCLFDLESESSNTNGKADELTRYIKDIAKKFFFEGKIKAFKDYVLDIPNESHSDIHLELMSGLPYPKAEIFLFNLKRRIKDKLIEQDKEPNLENLMEVLDYGHLKGFLSLFRL